MAKQRPRVKPPRRGDVYLVALGPAVSAEIQKTRPAVVIQNDSANRASPITIVAAGEATFGDTKGAQTA